MSTDWTAARRIACRFGVVYLTLFCLATQISGSLLPNPWFTYRGLGRLWPMRQVTHWVARTFYGIDVPLDDVSGGETIFFWIQWSWLIVAAVVITAAWSLLTRRDEQSLAARSSQRTEAAVPWWHLLLRFALAASLLEYGMTKVIPTQFPAPPLTALVTPVGEMTLSALLWTTIGSAPAYQIATGCVEVLAGVLLLLPHTVLLGALLAVVSLLQVLLLNLTFDIGVKLVTMHLIAIALILLAPALPQLAGWVGVRAVWVWSRRGLSAIAADPTAAIRLKPDSTQAPSNVESGFSRIDRRLAILPIMLGVYLLATQAWINWNFWNAAGGGAPKSALYGIWNVDRLLVDGGLRPAELNDYDRRWRRVIFDQPDIVVFQRTDDSFARYGVSVDRSEGTLALTKGGSRTWSSRFTFDRRGDDRLSLSGEMDGHHVEVELRRVDPSELPLLNSRFRWVRPHDP